MKKLYFLLLTLLISTASFGQTTIDFDTAADWTYTGSYGAQTYSNGDFSFVSEQLYRNTTSEQDGFVGAYGTYSLRLRNNSTSEVTFTIASGGVQKFLVSVRRWDSSPSPDFNLEFSIDGGTNWTLVQTINNTSLGDSSNWSSFGATIASNNADVKIRFKSNGSTERIMIDNFVWTEFGNDATLSVVENQIEGFSMYPNPAVDGSFTISSKSNTVKQVEIYSLLGNLVVSKSVKSNEKINISNLSSGFYMVKVEEDGKIATRKLLVK